MIRRLGRWGLRVVVAIVVVLVVAAVAFPILTRTQIGYEVVLRLGLSQARKKLTGELTVGGIGSRRGLVTGVVLRDVTLRERPGDPPMLQVDSVVAGYSLWRLIRGDFTLSRIELWRPRVVVESGPDPGGVNWARIFRTGSAEPIRVTLPDSLPPADTAGTEGPGGTARGEPAPPPGQGSGPFVLRGIVVHQGDVVVSVFGESDGTSGSSGSDGSDHEPARGGEARIFHFQDVDAEIPELRLLGPDGADSLRVRALSMTAKVLDEPFHLDDFRGTLERRGNRIAFDADRLWLPDTEAQGSGSITLAETGPEVDVALTAVALDTRSFRWLEPRLPEARGSLSLGVELVPGSSRFVVTDIDLLSGPARVRGRIGVELGSGVRIVGGDLELASADPAWLDPWLPEPLPELGRVDGRIRMNGTLSALQVAGRLAITEPGATRPSVQSEFDGIVHAAEPFGVSRASLTLAPLEYGFLARFDPRVRLRGPGSIRLTADGRLDTRLTLDATVAHRPTGAPASEVAFRGTVGRVGEDVGLSLDGELRPLSFTALGAYYPDLPVTGEARGPVRLEGLLSDLRVQARIETPGGSVTADARLDARDPTRQYQLEAEVSSFDLHRLVADLPDPTRITGHVFVDGRGATPETVAADVRATLGPSSVGLVRVDSARTSFRLAEGRASVDTLTVAGEVGRIDARGELALAEGVPDGTLLVELSDGAIGPLQPLLMGRDIIAGDTLSPLEKDILRLQGHDPDTLPELAQVTVAGAVQGSATLTGSVRDFALDGSFTLDGLVHGLDRVGAAVVTVSGSGLPSLDGRVEARIAADSLLFRDMSFRSAAVDLEYQRPRGRVALEVRQNDEDSYWARAAFESDSTGGVVNLDELTLTFSSVRWNLGGPARVTWDPERYSVQDFRLIRPGGEGMEIVAEGTIPRGEGSADFRLDIENLRLERAVGLAQSDAQLSGLVNLDLVVSGTARSPTITGSVSASELRFQELEFSRIEGSLDYVDRMVTVGLEAWKEDRPVLSARGGVPADLSLVRVERRFPDQPMDVTVGMDAFPVGAMMGFIEGFERVEGVIDGEIHIGGSPTDLQPSGRLTLSNASADLVALGVRHTGVNAAVDLATDGTVTVSGRLRSRGEARVEGTIALDSIGNPRFDLTIRAEDFQAVNRRDVVGRVGGEIHLTGSFRRPLVRGDITVQQGVLFLDEFVRAATIVDLTDPAFFNVVDTSLVSVRPILEAYQNPFLDNLRMDVNVSIQRDAWLRGQGIDMEMTGDLQMFYDRTNQDLVLVGELTALRGAYTAFGRQFQIREGTVEFIGIPGMNPNLSIRAVNRLRLGDETLNIVANVEGTLAEPAITLTSDTPTPIAESDLYSYLVFGRPAALLAGSESSILQGFTEATITWGLGSLANQLGSAVAQEIGFLDYFAITQSQATAALPGADLSFRNTLASTQIEAGRYIGNDIFLAFLLRPVTGPGQSQNQFAGARLEWRFADQWTVEGFVEDRLLRQGVSAYREGGLDLAQSWGLFIYRQWGY